MAPWSPLGPFLLAPQATALALARFDPLQYLPQTRLSTERLFSVFSTAHRGGSLGRLLLDASYAELVVVEPRVWAA